MERQLGNRISKDTLLIAEALHTNKKNQLTFHIVDSNFHIGNYVCRLLCLTSIMPFVFMPIVLTPNVRMPNVVHPLLDTKEAVYEDFMREPFRLVMLSGCYALRRLVRTVLPISKQLCIAFRNTMVDS